MMCTVLPVDEADSNTIKRLRKRMKEGVPPADVQEYLWRVKQEAEQIPDIILSEINPRNYDYKQTPNMPLLTDLNDAVHDSLIPNPDWVSKVLADFAELRQLISRWQVLGVPTEYVTRVDVPQKSDMDGWHRFFFGTIETKEIIIEETVEDVKKEGAIPRLQLLLQFDQILTRKLLEHHTYWLSEIELHQDYLLQARVSWIYALLARLDKPVHAEVAATIREILRSCWKLRDTIPNESELRNDSHVLTSLNLLIVITGEEFHQFA